MAFERIIEIAANVKQAVKEIGELYDELRNVQDQAVETSEAITTGAEENNDNFKKLNKTIKTVGDGFKGVGLAMKALGIGIIIKAVDILTDMFMKNQGVVDAVESSMNFLNIALNDFIGFITKNFGSIQKFFTDIFDNPQESIKKLGTLIKENLIERFNSMVDALGFAGEALVKFFKGDWEGAAESAKKAGKELVDVTTGINNSWDKGKQALNDLVGSVSDYVKKTWDAAAALQAQANAAKIGAAQNALLLEQYDRMAEQLRQIRDNDLLGLPDRIRSNAELGKVLDQQAKLMTANADLAVQQARNQYSLNKSIENQVALIQAQADKEGILAQIEGLRSEQKQNAISLMKEERAMIQSLMDAEAVRSQTQFDFNASLERDELKRLALQRQGLEADKIIESERLRVKRDSFEKETQAYADAQIELLAFDQEIQNKITQNQIDSDRVRFERKIADNDILLENEKLSFEARLEALNQQDLLILDNQSLSERERTEMFRENGEARKKIWAAEKEARLTQLTALSGALSQASDELGESTLATKLFSAAAAAINTYVAISGQLAAFSGIPIPGYAIAQAIATGIFGLIQVKKILSVKVPGGGGGGGAAPASATPSGGSASSPPVYNVVGQSSTNQLAQNIGTQQERPVQAYVVGSEVTTQQALERNAANNSSYTVG